MRYFRGIFVLLAALLLINTVQAMQYMGCYRDAGDPLGTQGRDLSGNKWSNTPMSAAACVEHCKKLGYIFAATQYADHCFCDNNYGSLGKADNCNMPCAGNPSELCGGAWANSVYHVGRERSGKPMIQPNHSSAQPGGLSGRWQCKQQDAFITATADVSIQQNTVSVRVNNHDMMPNRVIDEELIITTREYDPYRKVQRIYGKSQENNGEWVVKGTFREPGRTANIVADYWYIETHEGDPGKITVFVSDMGNDWGINCQASRM